MQNNRPWLRGGNFNSPRCNFIRGNNSGNWNENRGNFNYRPPPPGPPPSFFQSGPVPPPRFNQHIENYSNGNDGCGNFRHGAHHAMPNSFHSPDASNGRLSGISGNGFNRGRGGYRGRGVKRTFTPDSAFTDKHKKQKVDKRDLPENNKFVCEPCDRGYKNEEAYKIHCDGHEKCKEEGCSYVAAPKLVELHYNWQHKTGLAKKIWQLESKEDIEKWRQERRKNFPTQENIERKKKERQDRIARGEVLETKQFGKMKGQNRGNRGRGRGGRGQGRGRGRYRDYDNPETSANSVCSNDKEEGGEESDTSIADGQKSRKRNRRGKKRRRNNNREVTESGDQPEATKLLKLQESNGEKSQNSSDVCSTTQKVVVQSISDHKSSEDSSSDVEITGVEQALSEKSVDPLSIIIIKDDESGTAGVEPLRGVSGREPSSSNAGCDSNDLSGALGALASTYADWSSDSDAETYQKPKDAEAGEKNSVVEETSGNHGDLKSQVKNSPRNPTKGPTSHVNEEIDHHSSTQTKSDSIEYVPNNTTVKVKTEKFDKSEDVSNAAKVQPAKESGSVAMDTVQNANNKQGFNSQQKGRAKQKKTFRCKPIMSRKRLTLLQKLLASDIRHERNVIMQCIRHIVRKEFFGTLVKPKNCQKNPTDQEVTLDCSQDSRSGNDSCERKVEST